MRSEDVRSQHEAFSPLWNDMNLLLKDRMLLEERNRQFIASMSLNVGRLISRYPDDRALILAALASGLRGQEGEDAKFVPFVEVYSVAKQMRDIAIDIGRRSVHVMQDVQARLGLTQNDEDVFDVVFDSVRVARHDSSEASDPLPPDQQLAERFEALRGDLATFATGFQNALDSLSDKIANIQKAQASDLDAAFTKQNTIVEQSLAVLSANVDATAAKIVDADRPIVARLDSLPSDLAATIDSALTRVEGRRTRADLDRHEAIMAAIAQVADEARGTGARLDVLEQRWSNVLDGLRDDLLRRSADDGAALSAIRDQIDMVAEGTMAESVAVRDMVTGLCTSIADTQASKIDAAAAEQRLFIERTVTTLGESVVGHVAKADSRFASAAESIEARLEALPTARDITERLATFQSTTERTVGTTLSSVAAALNRLQETLGAAFAEASVVAQQRVAARLDESDERWCALLDDIRRATESDRAVLGSMRDDLRTIAEGLAAERASFDDVTTATNAQMHDLAVVIHRSIEQVAADSQVTARHLRELVGTVSGLSHRTDAHAQHVVAAIDAGVERTVRIAGRAPGMLADVLRAQADQAALLRKGRRALSVLIHAHRARHRTTKDSLNSLQDALTSARAVAIENLNAISAQHDAHQATHLHLREELQKRCDDLTTRIDARTLSLESVIAAGLDELAQISRRVPEMLGHISRNQDGHRDLLNAVKKALSTLASGQRSTVVEVQAIDNAIAALHAGLTEAVGTVYAATESTGRTMDALREAVIQTAHPINRINESICSMASTIDAINAGATANRASLNQILTQHEAIRIDFASRAEQIETLCHFLANNEAPRLTADRYEAMKRLVADIEAQLIDLSASIPITVRTAIESLPGHALGPDGASESLAISLAEVTSAVAKSTDKVAATHEALRAITSVLQRFSERIKALEATIAAPSGPDAAHLAMTPVPAAVLSDTRALTRSS